MPDFRNPFVGPKPVSSTLYGRDRDLSLMRDRVYGARATLLFAASAVGKTSFLQAKFKPEMDKRFVTVYHNQWKDPLLSLKQSIRDEFQRVNLTPPGPDSVLHEFFPEPSRKYLLILDQFEELFHYYDSPGVLRQFLDEISEVINVEDLPVRVLLSMREDFLGELSVFDGRIPDVYRNHFRLQNPDVGQASAIIRSTARDGGAEVDEPRLAALVEDLSRLRAGGDKSDAVVEYVAPPYLQIVCQRIWNEQTPARDRLFLAGYAAGSARVKLKSYVEEKINGLRRGDQILAARAFDFLVTSKGAKMPYELDRLSEHMKTPKDEIRVALDSLRDAGILRKYDRPNDSSEWYELYHDMYASLVDEWKQSFEQAESARRSRRTAGWMTLVLTALVLCYGLIYRPWSLLGTLARADSTFEDRHRAYQALTGDPFSRLIYQGSANLRWAEYWDRRAADSGQHEEQDNALLFRLKAWAATPSDRSRAGEVARLVAEYGGLRNCMRMDSPRVRVQLSTDGRYLLAWADGNRARIWDLKTGKASSPEIVLPDQVNALTVRPNGNLVTGANDGTISEWDSTSGRPLSKIQVSARVSVLSYDVSGNSLLIGTSLSNGTGYGTAWFSNAQGRRLIARDTFGVGSAILSRDGAYALIGFASGKLNAWAAPSRLWNPLPTGNYQNAGDFGAVFDSGRPVAALAFPSNSPPDQFGYSAQPSSLLTVSLDRSVASPVIATTDTIREQGLALDGNSVISFSTEGLLKRWDIQTGTLVQSRQVPGLAPGPLTGNTGISAASVAIQPDAKFLAASGNRGDDPTERRVVRIWSAEELAGARRDAASAPVENDVSLPVGFQARQLQFNLDRRRLAVLEGIYSPDTSLKLEWWDLAARKALATPAALPASSQWVMSQSGEALAWTDGETVHVRSARGEDLELHLGARSCSLALSPDDRIVAAFTCGGVGRLWSIPGKIRISTEDMIRGADPGTLEFAPNGALLLARNDTTGEMRVWSVPSGQRTAVVPFPPEEVRQFSHIKSIFRKDGSYLVTWNPDGMIRVFRPARGELVAGTARVPVNDVAICEVPQSPVMITGSPQGILNAWSFPYSQQIASWNGAASAIERVFCSPDGQTVAAVTPRWAHLYEMHGKSLRHLRSVRLQGTFTREGGFAGGELKLLVRSATSQMTLQGIPAKITARAAQGNPEELLKEWMQRLGLRFDGGQFIPPDPGTAIVLTDSPSRPQPPIPPPLTRRQQRRGVK